MFGKLRRSRKGQPGGEVALASAVEHGSPLMPQILVEPRTVGTTLEDQALLARIYFTPPTWDNPVPTVTRVERPEQSLPWFSSKPGAPSGQESPPEKGGSTWDIPRL
jgi:hypothetical protein